MGKGPVKCIDRHSCHSCGGTDASQTIMTNQYPVAKVSPPVSACDIGLLGGKGEHATDESTIRE